MSKRTEQALAPLAIGTGLIALDVIVTDDQLAEAHHSTGGTCGNVLLGLRYLGFKVAPVARLQNDAAARLIRSEFLKLGVDTEFVSVEEEGSTPVIVQSIRSNPGGVPSHSFSWRCPSCGARFPGYKPALATTAETIVAKMSTPQVFFFDRVNRGALILAERAAKLGALVVFEPSSVSDQSHFQEAWGLAHVVKYSHERLADLPDSLDFGPNLLLQVETLGADGLRYRAKFGKRATSTWQTLKALKAPTLIDAAGAGDWCTIGLLHRLGRKGAEGFRTASPGKLEDGLRFGQALAAWCCGYAGARGGMNQITVEECLDQVKRILAGQQADALSPQKHRRATRHEPWCPVCSDEQATEVPKPTSKRTTA